MERGFGGANLDEIVRSSGVSRQTIYNHFGDKVSLFRAMCVELTDEVTSQLLPSGARDLDPVTVLTKVGVTFLDLVLRPSSLALHRIIIAEATRFPDLGREIYSAAGARSIAALAGWLRHRSENGELSIDDPESAAGDFFALVRGNRQIRALLGVPVEQTARDRKEIVNRAVCLFLKAYRP